MSALTFDARQVAPDQGELPPFPTGWYVGMIVKTEVKPTKDTMGTLLEYVTEIQEGMHKGRRVYGTVNLQNNNPQAVEIGLRQLSAICHATGVLQLTDTQQLHNRPFRARMKYVAADGTYAAKNQAVAFKHMSEQVPDEVVEAPKAAAAPALNLNSPQQSAQPWAPQANVQAPAQPPAQAPAQQWQQPTAEQPWQQPQTGQQNQTPVHQPPAPQPAPAPQQQAQAPAQPPAAAPAWQQPQGAGVAQPPAQAPAPAPNWAQAPATDPGAVTQQPQQQAQAPAPVTANPNPATPPWSQPQG